MYDADNEESERELLAARNEMIDFDEWLEQHAYRFLGDGTGKFSPPYGDDPPAPSAYLWPASPNQRPIALWTCLSPHGKHFAPGYVLTRMSEAMRQDARLQGYDHVLASPYDIRHVTPAHIRTLDAANWFECWEQEQNWQDGVAWLLDRRLGEIPLGRGAGASAPAEFEQWVADALKFLFFPSLFRFNSQDWNLLGNQRRDNLVTINPLHKGIWKYLSQAYDTVNLVVEAKNYSKPIEPDEVNSANNYLHPHAPGLLGVLVSRKGFSDPARVRIRQLAAERRVLIPISADDMLEMFRMKCNGDDPSRLVNERLSFATKG